MLLYTAWTQRVAALGINKGNVLWSGGSAFVFCCYPDSAQSQKGSMQPKGRLMCQIPPSPFSFSLVLVSDGQGFHRASGDWFSPHPEIELVFHVGWYETFREGLVGWGRRGYCAGVVGLVLVEMTGWWCGDRQDWLELRKKCKTETDGKAEACSVKLTGLARYLIPTILMVGMRPRDDTQVVLVHIDLLSSNADWY